MMFGKMLIEINCLSYLSGKSDDKSFDDKQIAQITEALDGCSENLDVIFVGQIPPDSQKKSTNEKVFLNFYQNIMQKRSFRRFRHIKQPNLKLGLSSRQKQKI